MTYYDTEDEKFAGRQRNWNGTKQKQKQKQNRTRSIPIITLSKVITTVPNQ
jgi:hypothetical protein